MKFEKLYAWLKDLKSNLTFVRDYDRQENFMKVSFSEKIDLIYHQRVIDAHALAPKLPFFYCGLYNKQDGKLYAPEFPLKGNLPEIDRRNFRLFSKKLQSGREQISDSIL